MPKRTNLFQDVVEIIHRHMASGAVVEPSAMLPSRSTGEPREVDVVVRSKVAGHEVIVSVEAVGRSRKADRTWVDQMAGKHADLPTSRLVLVSEKGFTRDARAAATAASIVTVAPQDITDQALGFRIVNTASSLWPKNVKFTPRRYGVRFVKGTRSSPWPGGSAEVCSQDGTVIAASVETFVTALYKRRWKELVTEHLRDIVENVNRSGLLSSNH